MLEAATRHSIRVMKLSMLLLCIGLLHAQANTFAQKITIDVKNEPIETVFDAIKKQSSYVFFYASTVVEHKKPVTLKVTSASVEEILRLALKDLQLEFNIKGRTISIIEKKKEPEPATGMVADPPINVRGRVVNEQDEPVAGVTVQVKGTTKATSTDGDGEFLLTKVDPNATLVLTGVNIEAIETGINGKKEFSLRVKGKTGKLDEIVVIAYGTSNQRFNTGNVASVKAKDIEKQPVNNPLLSLQGRVAGLVITPGNGVPGGSVTVRVQGQNSLKKGNEPFYVIDGVPYVSQMLPTFATGLATEILGGTSGASGAVSSPLNYINPSDIESIEVLKDADATAIYGSRAANGAILITTKKGKAGPLSFQISAQTGWGEPNNKLDLLDTRRYLTMRKEALVNDLDVPDPARDYDIMGLYGWDTTRTTNWQKELLGRKASFTNLNASISGGNTQMQYLLGATFQRETSVFPGDFADKRGGLHFNFSSSSLNKKFNVQFSGNYLINENRLPRKDLTLVAQTLPPTAPVAYNADGTLNWALNDAGNSTWDNPLLFTLSKYKSTGENLITNLTLRYQILDGLSFKTSLGYNSLVANSYIPVPLGAFPPQDKPFSQRSADYSNNTIKSWIIEPQLNYNLGLGFAKLDVLVGATLQQTRSKGEALYGQGYNSDDVMENIRSAASISVNAAVDNVYKYEALFARVNFNARNRYIINLTARNDGSSRFGQNNRFHNFGAVGGAWIFSEEEIVKRWFPFLSFGKLRSSIGTTGSDQIGDYQFMNIFNPVSLPALVPYQAQVGLSPQGLTNPYLEWEQTTKFQSGIDLGFLNDRIIANVTYVRNRSSNQLLSYILPIHTGFGSVTTNLPAVIKNTAWEIALNTENVKGKSFSWSTSFNITIPQNRLVRYDGLATSPDAQFYELGQSLNIIRLYRFSGVDPNTGTYSFFTKAGAQSSTPDYNVDRTVIVNLDPQYYGGFQNTFTWKGVELDVFFQFARQHKANIARGNVGGTPGLRRFNEPVWVMDRWQKTGDITGVQRFNTMLSPNAPSLYDQYDAMMSSDVTYASVFFARLKNLSLSYNFPAQYISRLKLKTCKLFVHAQNLLTITNFDGLDPETGNQVLPPLRMLTAGFQLGF